MPRPISSLASCLCGAPALRIGVLLVWKQVAPSTSVTVLPQVFLYASRQGGLGRTGSKHKKKATHDIYRKVKTHS